VIPHEVLQAVILGRRSFLPLYSGNAPLAVSFLQKAHTLAANSASDVIRAWLMIVEAEAQATIGETEACCKALEQSEFLLHQSHPGYITCSFPSETIYAPFNVERLPGYKGACYLNLGQSQKAQSILHASMASAKHPSLHRQSITLIDLARAYAQQEELEEMYLYADQAIALLRQTKSPRVFQRVCSLRQELHSWQDTVSIKQLDQQLATISLSFIQEETRTREKEKNGMFKREKEMYDEKGPSS
jgi:tetratricopeptide (TPR) repeat protein